MTRYYKNLIFKDTSGTQFQGCVTFPITSAADPGGCVQAPEVFIGDYGVEADLWAAGMMMYQLIAGRFPYWPTMDSLSTTSLEQVCTHTDIGGMKCSAHSVQRHFRICLQAAQLGE